MKQTENKRVNLQLAPDQSQAESTANISDSGNAFVARYPAGTWPRAVFKIEAPGSRDWRGFDYLEFEVDVHPGSRPRAQRQLTVVIRDASGGKPYYDSEEFRSAIFMPSGRSLVSVPLAPAAKVIDIANTFKIELVACHNPAPTEMTFRNFILVRDAKAGHKSPVPADIAGGPCFKHRGVHICLQYARQSEDAVKRLLDRIAEFGFNTAMLEIGNALRYASFPGISPRWAFTPKQLRGIVRHGRGLGLEMIPMQNLLGHQHEREYPFLKAFPELSEDRRSPGAFCPSNKKTLALIERVMEETAEIFDPSFFHIGHDEIFLKGKNHGQRLGLKLCRRCRESGKSEARLFADHVNALCAIAREQCGARPMIWGDMLLAPTRFPDLPPYDLNGGHAGVWKAGGTIGKDIVICDWHYQPYASYPTADYFLDLGFEVWGATWWNTANNLEFSRYGKERRGRGFAGMLLTTWKTVRRDGAYGDAALETALKAAGALFHNPSPRHAPRGEIRRMALRAIREKTK